MNGRETIYALSSGAGRAGIAVVRVSGPQAAEAIKSIAGKLPVVRKAQFGALKDPVSGELLDRGIVLWFPGPNSATGEDIAEFHVHGSRSVVATLFEVLRRLPDCRPAEPGEFLRRAFSSGKVDLIEVEGLADLLAAETSAQRRLALRQATGHASSVFEDWRSKLLGASAHIEALIDFSEEEDTARLAVAGVLGGVKELAGEMEVELRRGRRAVAVRLGAKVVLAGPPNTGKSSLLNVLARRDVAIVSARPGTTRDVIEVPLDFGGVPITLTDTAGLRTDTGDEIEQIGIQRSLAEISGAEVVIWVAAADAPGSAIAAESKTADIVVVNKSDLGRDDSGLIRNDAGFAASIRLSAKTGEGIDEFIEALRTCLDRKYGQTELALLTRERQTRAVEDSIRHLNEALEHEGEPAEVLAEDLRSAAVALGRLTGRIHVEELLSSIFSEFCIGK